MIPEPAATRDGKERPGASVQISNEHRRLNDLYADLQRYMDRRAHHSAYSCFVRLRDALEAHFDVEDQVHFPTVRKFRPGYASVLRELQADHRNFRQDLALIEHVLAAGDLGESRKLIEDFVDRLRQHERLEEVLLAQLVERGRVSRSSDVPAPVEGSTVDPE
jgi:iron-sulfur cluster repair protein YtfE (RIC family)